MSERYRVRGPGTDLLIGGPMARKRANECAAAGFSVERLPERPSALTSLMDNVIAARLGTIWRLTRERMEKAGDDIDRGLILLRLLNESGFEVACREDEGER